MLRLTTLGTLSAVVDGGENGGAVPWRDALAMLALLAVSDERGVSRDKLHAYLWPELPDAGATAALDEVLSQLGLASGATVVLVQQQALALDVTNVAADVVAFERALDRRDAVAAVSCYGGRFLGDFTLPGRAEFNRWAQAERTRLEQRHMAALELLATEATARGEPEEAVGWWRELAYLDPLSTHVALSVIRSLDAMGDRQAALAHAREHAARVREEYHAQPSAAIEDLIQQLETPATADESPSASPRRASAERSTVTGEHDLDPLGTTREGGATIAGRYLVERELGRGGMATVLLARDLKHDRQVAVKLIHAELADALGTERFQREIAVVAKLQHPHILPMYDSGEIEGSLFYVMPYVGGETLRERLERDGALPVAEAVQLTREVADALVYAHSHGVIHRDIKPENILLAGGHALLTDFGIARAVRRAAGRRLTDDGFAIGTPAYMSPEQAAGDPVDGRSDLYCLGSVLYEMLTSQPPFNGTNATSILAQRLTEEPPSVRVARPAVSEPLAAVVQRTLARDPADRYASIEEFVRALDQASAERRAVRSARFRRWAWIGGGLASAGAIALALLASRPAPVDPDLYVVLPFAHRDSAATALLNGDNCEQLLYESFGRWNGVRLVDNLRTHDGLGRRPNRSLSFADAMRAARSLRAGRLAWGEVWQFNDSVRVRAALYDVASERTLREYTVAVRRDLSDAPERFTELADSLLVTAVAGGHADLPIAHAGARSTRSIAALEKYFAGHEALASWKLDSAQRMFGAAVEIDPGFADAQYWLAQVLTWSPDDTAGAWRGAAARAFAMRDRLDAHDSSQAVALQAMADGRFPDACRQYSSLVARDSFDFAAWYGLGECRRLDPVVMADSSSPSGWAFRGSYAGAIAAYVRALQILPSVHLAFGPIAYDRLQDLLFTEPTRLRRGYTVANDTSWFAAFPSLQGDTLAFVAFPFAEITSGKGLPPAGSTEAAVGRNRERLAAIAQTWVRAYPTSPAAYETLARALEADGRVTGTDSTTSALAAIVRARALGDSGDAVGAMRRAVMEVRVLLAAQQFASARALADSTLTRAGVPPPEEADEVKSLAALTGRVHRTVELLRASASTYAAITPSGEVVRPPLPLAQTVRALSGYVSFGAPADSVIALESRAEAQVQSFVDPRRREVVRQAVLWQPLTLAFPLEPRASLRRVHDGGDYLYPIHAALVQGDTAAALRQLQALSAQRAAESPGSLTLDFAFQEAWLLVRLADTANAERAMDRTLDAMSVVGSKALESVPTAASLVRLMALRAEVAAKRADMPHATRWANAVLTLWSDADSTLAPTRASMRAIVAGQGL